MSNDLQQWLDWAADSDKPRQAGHYIFRRSPAAGRAGDRETIDRLWAAAHEAGFLRFGPYRILASDVWDGPGPTSDNWDDDQALNVRPISDDLGVVTESSYAEREATVRLADCHRDDILTEAGAEAVNVLRLVNGKPDANGWVRFDAGNKWTWPPEPYYDEQVYQVAVEASGFAIEIAGDCASPGWWQGDGVWKIFDDLGVLRVTHWMPMAKRPVEAA